MSPTLGPTRVPNVPGSPVVATSPLIAWATTSNAGQSAYGLSPVRGSPKPRMAPYTSRGLISASAS